MSWPNDSAHLRLRISAHLTGIGIRRSSERPFLALYSNRHQHYYFQPAGDRTILLTFALHASLAANPTSTLCSLLSKTDIAATFLGKVSCRSIAACQFLPVADALTRLTGRVLVIRALRSHCPAGPALSFSPTPQRGWYRRRLRGCRVLPRPPYIIRMETCPIRGDASANASALILQLTIFHNLILTNLSELVVQDHQAH
ncbi:hypothetical protein COOONC_28209 [Cooperia oncophora]